jgi:GNAT superfamily N-acetyltransferase
MKLRPIFRARRSDSRVENDRVDQTLLIPKSVAANLIDDNAREPLCRYFCASYAKGKPGVTRETAREWVVRDPAGRVVGGVRANEIPGYPWVLDVAVDRQYRRHGFATELYRALAAAGIDVEASSNAALRHGTMTALGYGFMIGRRRRTQPEGRDPVEESLDIVAGPVAWPFAPERYSWASTDGGTGL